MYLGAKVGPTAHSSFWQGAQSKLKSAANMLAGMGLHWATSMRWYTTAVQATCMYLGSLRAPSAAVCRAEADALAKVLHIPNGSIPMSTLAQFKCYGAKHAVADIATMSIAARARVYVCSPLARDLHQHYTSTQYPHNDDGLVQPPYPDWHSHSIITQLHTANQHIYDITGFQYTYDTSRVQRKMLNDLLQELPKQALYRTLASRLNHWDEQYDEMQFENMIGVVKAVSSLVPPFVLYSFIRSAYNAWNTEMRYGRDFHCRWCKMCHSDHLLHYLACPAMLANFGSLVTGISELWHTSPHPPFLPRPKSTAFLIGLTDHTVVVKVVLMHDLLHFAFCEAKHGHFSGQWRALYRTRARQWIQHKSTLRQFL